MFKVHRINSVDWKPSPVVALATSPDGSRVAAARADGSLEIWLVSPGSVGWHCLLTIHGDPSSRVSSLVWLHSGLKDRPLGRLLSSSIDGTISEWDFFDLRQKEVLDSIGISIWQMAAEPCNNLMTGTKQAMELHENGPGSPSINSSIEEENSDSERENGDSDNIEPHGNNDAKNTRIAIACDDGRVRIYSVSEADLLTYSTTLPRVSGRTLSVAWSFDASRIYSGSSDGSIRCWDVKLGHEIYRVTAGGGSLEIGSDICIWSLLVLRCGTIVSGDSSGSVQFWDGQLGTLLQAHSCHKGDVNALAVAPSHNRVFSAGSDGQVILYKLSSLLKEVNRWVYVGYVRAHTHDVKALTVAVPICDEDLPLDGKVKRLRGREKPLEFSYHKWAALGVPMLISAGDDTKLFAYTVKEFTKFSPHDICPAPQRPPMQLVRKAAFFDAPMLLIQAAHCVDIYYVRLKNTSYDMTSGLATRELVARVKCKDSQKIMCSTISSSGTLFAYSDNMKPKLFKLEKSKSGNSSWSVNKQPLPRKLPSAHCMLFTSDSSRLLLAGQDRKIYVVDVVSCEAIHVFIPCGGEKLLPDDLPITNMFASNDGQWLAAVNYFGDLYIFNLETLRQHWCLSRLDGASVTAGGFTPQNGNILIVCTSSNQLHAFDIDAKKPGEWSRINTFSLPKRYQEFPGEVIGLSFKPSSSSSSAIVYSPRAMCMIDFGLPVDRDDEGQSSKKKRKQKGRTNFEFCSFRDPVLYVQHLSDNSLLVVDKPWIKVVDAFDTQPLHRHVFGT